MAIRFLRMKDLPAVTGEAKSTNYQRVADGLLPPPVLLGPQSRGWPDYEIERIQRARIAGADDHKIRELVKTIVADRANAAAVAA